MAQCSKYPKECNGLVRRDSKDKKWYCAKHFYDFDHMKATGRKISLVMRQDEERRRDEERRNNPSGGNP